MMGDYMSAGELKEKLYEHFRDNGSLDLLRTQLRSQLANEIFKVASPLKASECNEIRDLLPLQVSNWLVYDHLKRSNFEYALSTFVSEANLSHPEKLLSIKDILNMVGIGEGSEEYTMLIDSYKRNSKESFLYLFLSSASNNLKNKAKKKNKKPDGKNDNLGENKDVNTVDGEKSPLAEMHPANVFGPYNDMLPVSNYRARNIEEYGLFNRQLQLEKEKHELEMLGLRQKLLRELDNLHDREYRQKLELEKENNRLIREQSLLNMEREKLKLKEVELQTKLEALDREVDERVKAMVHKLPDSPQHKELFDWEFRVKEQQEWLENEIKKIKAQSSESKELQQKIREMEESCRKLQKENSLLVSKNSDLQMQINSMSDYAVTKEELSWKTRKLADTERELLQLKSEMEAEKRMSFETIRKLQQQLVQTLPKFTGTLGAHDGGHEPTASYKRNSIDDIDGTRQMCQAVLKRVQEQKDEVQELHRLMHNLYNHLNQNVAPESNKGGILKHGDINQSSKQVPIQSAIQRSMESANLMTSSENLYSTEKYTEKEFQFILDAKKRIEALDKESQALEERYSAFISAAPSLISHLHIPFPAMNGSKNVYSVRSNASAPPVGAFLQFLPTAHSVGVSKFLMNHGSSSTFDGSQRNVHFSQPETVFQIHDTAAKILADDLVTGMKGKADIPLQPSSSEHLQKQPGFYGGVVGYTAVSNEAAADEIYQSSSSLKSSRDIFHAVHDPGKTDQVEVQTKNSVAFADNVQVYSSSNPTNEQNSKFSAHTVTAQNRTYNQNKDESKFDENLKKQQTGPLKSAEQHIKNDTFIQAIKNRAVVHEIQAENNSSSVSTIGNQPLSPNKANNILLTRNLDISREVRAEQKTEETRSHCELLPNKPETIENPGTDTAVLSSDGKNVEKTALGHHESSPSKPQPPQKMNTPVLSPFQRQRSFLMAAATSAEQTSSLDVEALLTEKASNPSLSMQSTPTKQSAEKSETMMKHSESITAEAKNESKGSSMGSSPQLDKSGIKTSVSTVKTVEENLISSAVRGKKDSAEPQIQMLNEVETHKQETIGHETGSTIFTSESLNMEQKSFEIAQFNSEGEEKEQTFMSRTPSEHGTSVSELSELHVSAGTDDEESKYGDEDW